MNSLSETSRPTPPECKAKPYPRTCPECGQNAVQPTEVVYELQAKHDGQTHRFHIPHLVVDKCPQCDEELFTSRANHQITEGDARILGAASAGRYLSPVG